MPTKERPLRVPGQPTPLPSADHILLMREWLELLPNAVVFLSVEGRVTFANHRARDMFCRRGERLVGKTRAYCVRRGIFDGAYLQELDAATMQTMYFVENVSEREITLGRTISTVRISYTPVALGGSYRGVLGVFEDVTEMRQAADLRDDLMAMMFHDMKHPLSAIMLNLDGLLLLDDGNLTAQQTEFVMTAKGKVQEMHEMFTKMVDIGKLEHRQLPLTLVTFDMNELVERVLRRTFALQFDKAGKRLLLKPSRHLIPITGDASLIERVVANLVDNALRYTKDGGAVEVRTALGSDRKSVRVHVYDEGPGVSQRFHKVIFEKYRQVQMRRAGVKAGVGLGLAFCKLAVDAHGGTIGVKNLSAGGSDFYFSLPCSPQATE